MAGRSEKSAKKTAKTAAAPKTATRGARKSKGQGATVASGKLAPGRTDLTPQNLQADTDTDARPPSGGVADILGQVAWLMMSSPMHKHMFMSDLEWLVLPPVMLRQFRIFHKDEGPVAYASWAFLDDGAGERMAAGNVRLAPMEWDIGDQAWLIDLITPFGGHERILRELKNQIFAGRSLKSLQAAPDGSGMAVVEW